MSWLRSQAPNHSDVPPEAGSQRVTDADLNHKTASRDVKKHLPANPRTEFRPAIHLFSSLLFGKSMAHPYMSAWHVQAGFAAWALNQGSLLPAPERFECPCRADGSRRDTIGVWGRASLNYLLSTQSKRYVHSCPMDVSNICKDCKAF
jgi:hypothetical protein